MMSDNGCYKWKDYLALPVPKQKWIIDQLLPIEGWAVIAGPPKAKKSFLILQLIISLAHGDPWLGHNTGKFRIFYLQLDTPRVLWKDRLDNLLLDGLKITDEAADNIVFTDSRAAPYPFDILEDNVAAWLKARCDEYAPQIVIIDTLSKCHSGAEDSRDDMEKVMSCLKAATNHAAILFITHERKAHGEDHSTAINKIRGSSVITASADLIMNLKKATRDSDARLSICGRSCEEKDIDLKSLPNHFFELADSEKENKIWAALLAETRNTYKEASREASRYLYSKMQEAGVKSATEEACRNRLRRFVAGS